MDPDVVLAKDPLDRNEITTLLVGYAENPDENARKDGFNAVLSKVGVWLFENNKASVQTVQEIAQAYLADEASPAQGAMNTFSDRMTKLGNAYAAAREAIDALLKQNNKLTYYDDELSKLKGDSDATEQMLELAEQATVTVAVDANIPNLRKKIASYGTLYKEHENLRARFAEIKHVHGVLTEPTVYIDIIKVAQASKGAPDAFAEQLQDLEKTVDEESQALEMHLQTFRSKVDAMVAAMDAKKTLDEDLRNVLALLEARAEMDELREMYAAAQEVQVLVNTKTQQQKEAATNHNRAETVLNGFSQEVMKEPDVLNARLANNVIIERAENLLNSLRGKDLGETMQILRDGLTWARAFEVVPFSELMLAAHVAKAGQLGTEIGAADVEFLNTHAAEAAAAVWRYIQERAQRTPVDNWWWVQIVKYIKPVRINARVPHVQRTVHPIALRVSESNARTLAQIRRADLSIAHAKKENNDSLGTFEALKRRLVGELASQFIDVPLVVHAGDRLEFSLPEDMDLVVDGEPQTVPYVRAVDVVDYEVRAAVRVRGLPEAPDLLVVSIRLDMRADGRCRRCGQPFDPRSNDLCSWTAPLTPSEAGFVAAVRAGRPPPDATAWGVPDDATLAQIQSVGDAVADRARVHARPDWIGAHSDATALPLLLGDLPLRTVVEQPNGAVLLERLRGLDVDDPERCYWLLRAWYARGSVPPAPPAARPADRRAELLEGGVADFGRAVDGDARHFYSRCVLNSDDNYVRAFSNVAVNAKYQWDALVKARAEIDGLIKTYKMAIANSDNPREIQDLYKQIAVEINERSAMPINPVDLLKQVKKTHDDRIDNLVQSIVNDLNTLAADYRADETFTTDHSPRHTTIDARVASMRGIDGAWANIEPALSTLREAFNDYTQNRETKDSKDAQMRSAKKIKEVVDGLAGRLQVLENALVSSTPDLDELETMAAKIKRDLNVNAESIDATELGTLRNRLGTAETGIWRLKTAAETAAAETNLRTEITSKTTEWMRQLDVIVAEVQANPVTTDRRRAQINDIEAAISNSDSRFSALEPNWADGLRGRIRDFDAIVGQREKAAADAAAAVAKANADAAAALAAVTAKLASLAATNAPASGAPASGAPASGVAAAEAEAEGSDTSRTGTNTARAIQTRNRRGGGGGSRGRDGGSSASQPVSDQTPVSLRARRPGLGAAGAESGSASDGTPESAPPTPISAPRPPAWASRLAKK